MPQMFPSSHDFQSSFHSGKKISAEIPAVPKSLLFPVPRVPGIFPAIISNNDDVDEEGVGAEWRRGSRKPFA